MYGWMDDRQIESGVCVFRSIYIGRREKRSGDNAVVHFSSTVCYNFQWRQTEKF